VKRPRWKRKLWMVVTGIVVAVLAAAVFTVGSLKIPPEEGGTLVVFFALTTIIAAALLVFLLILG